MPHLFGASPVAMCPGQFRVGKTLKKHSGPPQAEETHMIRLGAGKHLKLGSLGVAGLKGFNIIDSKSFRPKKRVFLEEKVLCDVKTSLDFILGES